MKILIADDHPLFRAALSQAARAAAVKCEVLEAEDLDAAIATLERNEGVDLVLLDPPFDAQQLVPPALAAAARAVRAGGFVYLEASRRWEQDALDALGLALRRHLKAGAVHAHLLLRPVPGV